MSVEPPRYSQGFHTQDLAFQGETGIALDKYHLRLIPAEVAEDQVYWKVVELQGDISWL